MVLLSVEGTDERGKKNGEKKGKKRKLIPFYYRRRIRRKPPHTRINQGLKRTALFGM